MFETTASIAGIQPKRRTHQPVRRKSKLAGQCENWHRTDRRTVSAVLFAAKRFDRAHKVPGQRNGPLGYVALAVLEYFAELIHYRTGRLDPSLDRIMAKTRLSRGAIVRGLEALRKHGFLNWVRRYLPTGEEGKGPQVKQTSNAYRLCLPAGALALIGRWVGRPTPDDADTLLRARMAETAAYEKDEFDAGVAERLAHYARLRSNVSSPGDLNPNLNLESLNGKAESA